MKFAFQFFIVISISLQAFAVKSFEDSKKQKKSLPSLDLISEATQKQLNSEASVQIDKKTSEMSFSVSFGQLNPHQLEIEVRDTVKSYHFSNPIYQVVADFSAFPLYAKGKWGGTISLGYASTQELEGDATRLHMMPIQMALGYKMELSQNQKISPFILLGHGEMIYFQRGADQFNTSERSGYQFASLGLNLNLNEIGWVSNSRNQMDIFLKADRILTAESVQRDFRGTNYSLGLSINL